MLSLSSLLNPISTSDPRQTDSAPAPSYYSDLLVQRSAPRIALQEFPPKSRMSKDGAVFSKGKIKGRVVYPPFEKLDQNSLRAVRKFKIYPFGDIAKYPRHIPYNSEKKSFLEKTGRESFEVFQYTFQVPNDEKDYTVMWDYNVGLVRITPFFKCCKYSKTSPAKMLNMNPGLKDITHSITGGALAAQGYWMPFNCARAICATFCVHISGALIPLFGPDFPNMCVPLDSPEYGRHVIDSSIIKAATEEAYSLRSSLPPPNSRPSGPTSHPYNRPRQQEQRNESRQMPTPSPSTTSRGRLDSVSPRSMPQEFSISRHVNSEQDRGKRIRILRPNGHIEYSHTDTDSSIPHSEREASTPMTSPALSYASSGWTPCNLQERMRQNNTAFAINTSTARLREGREMAPASRENGPLSFTRALKHYATATTPSPVASPWLSAVPRDGPMHPALDLRNKLPPILHSASRSQDEVPRLGALGLGLRSLRGEELKAMNALLVAQERTQEQHDVEGVGKRSDGDGEYDADSDGSCPSPRAEKRRMKSKDLSERRMEMVRRERTPLPDERRDLNGRRLWEEQEKNAAVLALLSLSAEERDRCEAFGMGHGVKRKRCASL